ncbi:MAG: diguanylate cyclase response regulator [Alphaproteobacteria bacterium]|jgi:diguanylate cyclase (GGDEF)-like protein|nr:diguanylate cyclase response regulator [Alphaproteobacteria bacterium]MDP6518067.1 diguanylate cyclase response regulator [Alphaproteobacteria bacterium]|tara:strand:+ start:736 stop:1635 length:900 start_codon:yes stop_codon:yes gene_type:complete
MGDKHGLEVLLVEDDEIHKKFEVDILERIYGDGLDVTWARTAAEARRELISRRFDVCLMDYILEGADAGDILFDIDPFENPTPVIVVSAFDDIGFDKKVLARGAEDYLIKGRFLDSDLERAIHYAMSRRQRFEALKMMAVYDAVTGLPNRFLFEDRLQKAVEMSGRGNTKIGIGAVDLDDFKVVNDSYGHLAGDHVLRTVAGRIEGLIRSCDTVSRAGGDEFLIIAVDVGDQDDTMHIAEKVIAAVAAPIDYEGRSIKISCSAGVAVFPDDSGDIKDILRQADQAMYRAKGQGGNRASW